ncbi:PSD1 and planctomycete cytochrome C domain-containing protein [Schlesneria paludicola]|uniref:PSD1 and planctomycete cytochrome C domain-containing protein n=1 Tax=Schlesneria paludicola TaxID=360056 RepID=UPI00029A89FB|nr:PSD1 and planctomycete cytochrome C domain-containing protein [Schlesneria paludicola]
MIRRDLVAFALSWTFVILTTDSLWGADAGELFFETKIRPVLIERCFECHGRDQVKGGLRVDSRESLLKGGDSGPAIRPGNVEASPLILAIRRTDESFVMPPAAPLSAEVVHDFEHWVQEGANWPAYVPVKSRRIAVSSPISPRMPNDPVLQPALQLWLKADARPWKEGQAVALWEDESGRGHDLAATAGARQGGTGEPARFVSQSSISGFPAVRFEPASGMGGNATSAPGIKGDGELTMFVVARLKSGSDRQVSLLAGLGELSHPHDPQRARGIAIGLQSAEATGVPILVGGWGHNASPTNLSSQPVLDGPPVIMTLTKRRGPLAATSEILLNSQSVGLLTGSGESPDLTRRSDLGFFLGHAQAWAKGFSGDVAEVIVYNRHLTADERGGVEAHLSSKYRIPLAASQSEQFVEGGDPSFSARHWAFEPLTTPPVPATTNVSGDHPIDRFLAAKWSERQLKPMEQADARTLVRRLYFDLLGLPPTAEEMEQATRSLTPWNDFAWNELIERLLASPRYGERWGRHWLDVVRYADTAGDNADYPVPEARYYRDYVIDAFNADKPYDLFLREQLAGDLLAAEGPRERYAEQIAATGFLALSRRYATGPYELWHLTLEDTVDTVGQGLMGLTLRCARCHDHKFDPVTTKEYYGLYGIFESTQFPWAGAEEFQSKKLPREHFVPLIPAAEVEPLLAENAEKEKTLEAEFVQLEAASPIPVELASLADKLAAMKSTNSSSSELAAVQTEHDKMKRKWEAAKNGRRAPMETTRRRGYPESIPVAYAVHEGIARAAYVQKSGDPGQPGPVVARGVPTFMTSVESPTVPANESGRRQLAEWLTRPEHPLTSRVIVNRVWQIHFGQGIVATPSNFGLRGAPPTHPELLDWLARRFVADGWSFKQLHRLMLTSRVWRLASMGDTQNDLSDPANTYLWRHNRRRLDAESIRDAMLTASGQLDLSRPSAHPFPPIAKWSYTQHNQFKEFYSSLHRSVYLMTPRLQRHPFLSLFDGPDTNTTTGVRTSSIVTAQALYLMNNEEVKGYAEAFAKRVLADRRERRIETAFEIAYQRHPEIIETERIAQFLQDSVPRSDDLYAWTAVCRALMTSHEFFHVE